MGSLAIKAAQACRKDSADSIDWPSRQYLESELHQTMRWYRPPFASKLKSLGRHTQTVSDACSNIDDDAPYSREEAVVVIWNRLSLHEVRGI